jgi:hypothetical protein
MISARAAAGKNIKNAAGKMYNFDATIHYLICRPDASSDTIFAGLSMTNKKKTSSNDLPLDVFRRGEKSILCFILSVTMQQLL